MTWFSNNFLVPAKMVLYHTQVHIISCSYLFFLQCILLGHHWLLSLRSVAWSRWLLILIKGSPRRPRCWFSPWVMCGAGVLLNPLPLGLITEQTAKAGLLWFSVLKTEMVSTSTVSWLSDFSPLSSRILRILCLFVISSCFFVVGAYWQLR